MFSQSIKASVVFIQALLFMWHLQNMSIYYLHFTEPCGLFLYENLSSNFFLCHSLDRSIRSIFSLVIQLFLLLPLIVSQRYAKCIDSLQMIFLCLSNYVLFYFFSFALSCIINQSYRSSPFEESSKVLRTIFLTYFDYNYLSHSSHLAKQSILNLFQSYRKYGLFEFI